LSQENGSRSANVLLSYGVVLTLNVFSLAVFLAVAAIGITFHSWPVTIIGALLILTFSVHCIYIGRTGKEAWNARHGGVR
jgi:hypothetical protein